MCVKSALCARTRACGLLVIFFLLFFIPTYRDIHFARSKQCNRESRKEKKVVVSVASPTKTLSRVLIVTKESEELASFATLRKESLVSESLKIELEVFLRERSLSDNK